ncbi:bifunctional metallophosphatase/5'-nucleotidase [Butyrivibrio sp. FCS014]|uniref:bifunctional metallophosphatase/5'-nucleotidase n=1 Tax=Butyrivibrio sp. FCS014 TaxID=1408304 RepID=UPI0004662D61|nr:bifunctional UDP-sugar hydrolase/5'-nucleotidase [Butyrivibrio sp. FCS014]
MRKQRVLQRALSFLLALALVLTTGATAVTSYAYSPVAEVKTIADVPADLSGKTIILHSNDVHGAIGRYAYIASVKQNFQRRGAEVILVDSGDFAQGTSYVSLTKGADAVTSMNAAGYDIVTIGNHEFDYGQTQLKANLAIAKFKVVNANILDSNGNNVFNPNTMYTTKSGLKLGFFGVDTPETLTKSNPIYVQGLNFLSKGDLYNCGQKQVDELKAQGADLVICLAHLGVDKEASREGNSSDIFYNHVKGIDFLFDGHSHTVMSAESKEQMESTGTKLQTIGVLVIDDASKKIEDSYVLSLDGLQKEVITDAITTNIIKRVDAEYNVAIGKSEVELNGNKAPGNRTEETNMGDLVSEAMLWSITKDPGSVTVDPSHVIALTNGGGLRAPIGVGDITKKDVNTVLPFGNTLTVVYVTGEQLLEALEASTFCTPDPVGGYPQTTGIKFTINTGKSFAAGPVYPASTYHKPASINRVTIESINGQPFSKTDKYAVVTNNFISDGGDTYYCFTQSTEKYDTGIPLDEAVMEYIQTQLHGVVGTQYAQSRGDQTIN